MCISKSEVGNSGMPLALRRIVNLRSCKQIILQEKIKVKQNRDKSVAKQTRIISHLGYFL